MNEGRRDRQWIRLDEVTGREQHHPGVTHSADEIWLLARRQELPPECGPPPALVRGQGDWWCVLEMAQICRENQSYSFDGWSKYHEGPNCTLEMLRDSRRHGSEPMTWLSHFVKELDISSKETTATEQKTLVQCVRLSVVCDQLNVPKLHCLEEFDRRVCYLVEAYVGGGSGKPSWNSVRRFVSAHSSSDMVPLSMKSLALRNAKKGVETEQLRFCTIKSVLVFEAGEWETLAAPHMPVMKSKSKGKGKEERGPLQLAAAAVAS